jgi:aminotransferase
MAEANKKISIQLMSNSLGVEESKALKKVFKSKWIGVGGETKAFEKELGERVGCPRLLLTDTCTSALFLSMKLLNIGPGDEVIIPSIHFIGAANAIISVGAIPIFADVDIKTLNILPREIERLRTIRTKAVMVLHYGGQPCEIEKIMEISKKYHIHVIEDNANSPFTKVKGKYCGTFGDIGCDSFDAMKILCTGNGGAILLKTDELLHKAKELRYFGLKCMGQSGIDTLKENNKRWWEIDLNEIESRHVTCDILSAIGREQLKKVDRFIKRRKEVWDRYQKELAGIDWLQLPPDPASDVESSYYFYWITVKNNQRDKLAAWLIENGIYCSFRYYPLHFIKKYNYTGKPLLNAESINENVLNIPLHQNLSDKDISKVISVIKKFKAN